MSDLTVEGMAIAPGVVETIVAIAVKDVEGVSSLVSPAVDSLRQKLKTKSTASGIDIVADEEGKLHIAVRLEVYYGTTLPALANAVRTAISDAVSGQLGLGIAAIDVYIDAIRFDGQGR